ncbi:coiled-coil domain-containing protein [Salix suchowensis]|nr:coiled-coil domain-containing protein [Salix suchowensis]
MAKAMWKLFAKSKGQSNRYGTVYNNVMSKVHSSLAAARADNFYYPPEWPPKKGGLNKFHGQHALRERARKFDQGLLIIRYALWFGVRFNAEKKQVGNYYSSKIWTFTMKSACCKHEIVIQTDPKNCKYVIISGAQVGKNEEFDIEDSETFALPADEEASLLIHFTVFDHQEEDLPKKKEAEPVLVRLQRVSDARHLDDFSLIKTLRARMRSPGIRMLPTTEEDAASAAHSSMPNKKRLELEPERRKIRALFLAAGISKTPMTTKRF